MYLAHLKHFHLDIELDQHNRSKHSLMNNSINVSSTRSLRPSLDILHLWT